ncbi:MAG: hypothetical protein FD170_3972 [Bacteroidetes bacterium]|nr:MAG: hypothetical protein FD170_3972 [Bacteroidota bacterium]
MTDSQRQAEIAALKRMAEGHRKMIESMLVDNGALMTLIEVSEALNYHRQLDESERRKPQMKVLKQQ